MMTCTISLCRRFFLVIPVLAIGFWLFAEKGCVATPDASPVLASTTTGAEQPPHAASMAPGQSSLSAADRSLDQPLESKSRSIKRAAILLRKASETLGKDEQLAVRFIRQAIAILKHEVIAGLDVPEYDRVSVPSADDDWKDDTGLFNSGFRVPGFEFSEPSS